MKTVYIMASREDGMWDIFIHWANGAVDYLCTVTNQNDADALLQNLND